MRLTISSDSDTFDTQDAVVDGQISDGVNEDLGHWVTPLLGLNKDELVS
jgi:hypothetical protein